jgi:hypothetical protein
VTDWSDFTQELDRWAAAGLPATFWWRDDDAVDASPALDRLLALARGRAASVALAVIPAEARAALAQRLAQEPAASVVQHGFSHRNHAAPGRPKSELGAERAPGLVLGELARGALALDRLFGTAWLRVLVPPHNRIAKTLATALPEAGYVGVSTFGRKTRDVPGLAWINTHIDIMNWTTTRGFVGEDAALGAVVAELVRRRDDTGASARRGARDGDTPTGLLTHHLVHDEAAWHFLDRFLAALASHPAARVVDPRRLFAA